MSEVTRLWSPTRMLTVRQTLEDALAEVDEFELERIIIIGVYKNGSLMVSHHASHMSRPTGCWTEPSTTC